MSIYTYHICKSGGKQSLFVGHSACDGHNRHTMAGGEPEHSRRCLAMEGLCIYVSLSGDDQSGITQFRVPHPLAAAQRLFPAQILH